MSHVQKHDSSGFASRVKFTTLTGICAAVTAAHVAILMRVHHLPFIEGLPEEFHPRAIKYAATAFAAYLAFALPCARLMPEASDALWRRLTLSWGITLWPIAACLASREMTELFEGASSPGWIFASTVCAAVGIGAYVILHLLDVVTKSDIAGRTTWGFVATACASACYYFSLNSAIELFDQFALSLQYLILASASLAVALGVIIMRRKSPWWMTGISVGFGLMLLTSLPYAFASRRPVAHDALTVDAGKPRQVILITVDTLRADVLSCYGGDDAAPTPNLDSLAADGVMFMNATTHAPWTLPSMSSLFTGEDPRVHQCVNVSRRLPDRFLTPAQYFSEAGYHTQAIVHNAFLKHQYRFSRGFDDYQYVELIELGFEMNPLRRSPLLRTRRHNFSSTSLMITVEALRFVRRMKDRPYFLWLHYFDPHKPYLAPERLLEEIGKPGTTNARMTAIRNSPEEELEFARIEKSRYKSEVRYVDECLGRIFDELKRQGVYDKAQIALTSDHGEEFYEHGGYTHAHSLYNELLHVPLLWKSPDNKGAGRRVNARVPMAGLRGALLDSMNFQDENPASNLLAPSLMPFIEDENSTVSLPPMLGGAIDPSLPQGNSIIAAEWKLIERADREPELYDLKNDPGELSNLYKIRPQEAKNLKTILSIYEASFQQRRESLEMSLDENVFNLDEQTQSELRELGYLK